MRIIDNYIEELKVYDEKYGRPESKYIGTVVGNVTLLNAHRRVREGSGVVYTTFFGLCTCGNHVTDIDMTLVSRLLKSKSTEWSCGCVEINSLSTLLKDFKGLYLNSYKILGYELNGAELDLDNLTYNLKELFEHKVDIIVECGCGSKSKLELTKNLYSRLRDSYEDEKYLRLERHEVICDCDYYKEVVNDNFQSYYSRIGKTYGFITVEGVNAPVIIKDKLGNKDIKRSTFYGSCECGVSVDELPSERLSNSFVKMHGQTLHCGCKNGEPGTSVYAKVVK